MHTYTHAHTKQMLSVHVPQAVAANQASLEIFRVACAKCSTKNKVVTPPFEAPWKLRHWLGHICPVCIWHRCRANSNCTLFLLIQIRLCWDVLQSGMRSLTRPQMKGSMCKPLRLIPSSPAVGGWKELSDDSEYNPRGGDRNKLAMGICGKDFLGKAKAGCSLTGCDSVWVWYRELLHWSWDKAATSRAGRQRESGSHGEYISSGHSVPQELL